MEKAGKKGVIFQIWRSFILFILIPLVLLNIAIFYMLYDMENTAKKMMETRLSHAQFLLNQNITDSLVSVNQIGDNYNIQRVSGIVSPLTPADYGAIWKVQEFQKSMISANDAYSINTLCNGNNIFLTDNTFCLDLEQFYDKSYKFGQLSLEELKEYGHRGRQITFHPYSRYISGETWRDGIFYTTVMTPHADERTGATAIVFLNEENLLGILGEFSLWNGLTYLMDAHGQILYQTGNKELTPVTFELTSDSDKVVILSEKYFGKDYFAMVGSITTGLQIVSVIPERDLFMQMGSLRIFIWLLNGTTVIMCLFLSLIMAKKRGKILSRTLALMDHKGSGPENVFAAIYDSVSSMVDTNESLKNALGVQKELLQSVFWNRVLSVNSMSDEEISHLAQSAGFQLEAAGYCLLLIGFGNENEVEAEYWNLLLQKRKKVQEEIAGDFSFGGYVGSSGMDQLVILFPLDEAQSRDYQQYVAEKIQGLKQLTDSETKILCAGSTVFENLRDIYNAYMMCGSQMNLHTGYLETRSIIWCSEDVLGQEAAFYFTDELKNQIILWIKSGQQQLVKEGFHRILEENYLKRRISKTMEQLLISKLKLTLLGAYDSHMEINMTEFFEQIDKIQTDALMFSYFLQGAMDMCAYYLAGIRRHENGMQMKIENYIEEHCMEYGFGLSSIAGYCNLSETYFSQIFKEVIGENFSTYVEKKRMAYAYKLIVDSDITINMVAEKTGYSNTNAFRKAYKRFYGISPSQSRKNRMAP